MKKLITAAITLMVVFAAFIFLPESGVVDADGIRAEAASINTVNVKLYGMDDWAEKLISIPSSYTTKYQLKVTGASKVYYSVVSGNSVRVSSTGLIEPNYHTMYWSGGFGTSLPMENPDKITKEGIYGKSVIEVYTVNQTFKVNVEFIDYAEVYASKKMDEYISKNITSSMSGKDKLEKICKYVASFNYSALYSSASGMVLSGGGDCWASTDLILDMCKKLGISAWSRSANKDYGAGSGHMNAMAYVDGKYYQLDAGYTGSAPRHYDLFERKSLFSYHTNYDGLLEVYQYDGKTVPAKLVIPSTIDGVTVGYIGEDFITMNDTVKQIVLPNTIKEICSSAFNSCSKLKTLEIPASVESIGTFAFTNCSALTDFTCSSANKYYTVSKGVLYDKNKTTVISVPAASYVDFAPTVTSIADYAIYYNNNIKIVKLPDGLKSIGEGSICACPSLVTVIMPSSVKTIDEYAFYYDDNLKNVYYSGSKSQWNAIKIDRDTNAFLLNSAISYNYDAKTPIPVTGLKLKNRAADAIRLKWDVNPTADGYIIERYNGGKWVRVKKITNYSTKELKITGLKAGTTYKYRIKAYNTVGSKAYYSKVSSTLSATTSPKNAADFRLKARSTDALRLAWSKSSSADGYIIEKYSNGKWTRVKKITNGSAVEYRLSGLKAGTTYKFRIKTYKMVGKTALYSTVSKTVSATTQPAAVTGFSFKKISSSSIKLVWSKSTSADGYIIEKSSGSKWVRVKKLTSNSTLQYTINGIKSGSTYNYRIKTYKMVGSKAVYGGTKPVIVNKKITVKVGKELQLKPCSSVSPKSYTWKSANNKIATVTKSGKVLAWNAGKTTITASTKNGVSAEYILTVPSGLPVKNPSSLKTKISGEPAYNASNNNYNAWSDVMYSYLVQNSDQTLTRVECNYDYILVENYSSSGKTLKSRKKLNRELDYFGGFFSGSEYNYLVFGQGNPNDSNAKEVMRVVKYSKAWKRLSSVSIKGANTYNPFDAGSLRMTETGGKLYIHTCHTIYELPDGLHHQTNMSFVINEKTMKVVDSVYEIEGIAYTSHSFNQFIQTDGTYIYRVDHGDAYPRGIKISRSKVNGSIKEGSETTLVDLSNTGEIGDNYTGASVGGFELSSESCIVAFNAINYKTANGSPFGTRNIYAASINKDFSGVKTAKLTNYNSSSGVEVYTPQLVKIGADRFLIMWEEYYEKTHKIYTRMATINGRGTLTSDIVFSDLRLSDCQPILCKDGLVRWYVGEETSGTYIASVNPYDLYFGISSKYIILPSPKLSSVSNTDSGIKISWGKVSGAAQYTVFCKTDNTKWTRIGNTSSTSFVWKNAKKGTKYSFTVCCLSKNGKFYTSYIDSNSKTIFR